MSTEAEDIANWRKTIRKGVFECLENAPPIFNSESERLRMLFGIEVSEEEAISLKDKTDDLVYKRVNEDLARIYPSVFNQGENDERSVAPDSK